MPSAPDIVHLELFKYESEDFDLSLPVLNPDETPYTLPVGTQAKCTIRAVTAITAGLLPEFTFSTTAGTIIISGNIIALKADHAAMNGIVGDYVGEVLINIPPTDVDTILYVLHLQSERGSTENSLW